MVKRLDLSKPHVLREGLVEAVHLLRSPKNAERLLNSLRRALVRKGKAQTVAELRAQLGLQ